MRLRLLVAIVAAVPALTGSAVAGPVVSAPGGGRVLTSLDAGWRFHRGEVEQGAAADLDDSSWDQVTLPHSFNGADGDDGGGYYRGPGWYRRTLTLKRAPAGRAYLQFDGAALITEVTVNGIRLGKHAGGHARFRFDATPALREGRNLIAVRVDNTKVQDVPPLGGDFTLFGGLYRGVSLIETANQHIELMDYGSPGVRMVTRSLTSEAAELEAHVGLRNEDTLQRQVRLALVVRDAAGNRVASAERRVRLAPRGADAAVIPLGIARPRRWNGRKDPYLYSVSAELRGLDGASLDTVSVPLGLRTARFDPERGFLLNDAPYPLHGVNLFHSGRPGRGLAVTDREIESDMQTLDELGVTAIRFVHFQHPQRAYEEADRRGILLWTEIGLNGVSDPGEAFAANASQQMRELIRQNYNHPSVVLWGLGNEVYATTPDVTRVLERLQTVVKQEDPSRPTVYAHCCQADDVEKARVSDVIAFNRYFGWYPEQKGTIGGWADSFHSRYPAKPFLVGEYGAGASIRNQQLPPPATVVPTSGWHPEQTQTAYHELNWPQLAARPYLGGSFVWVAFDLASDGRREGDRPGINDKGLVSYDRQIKKDAYFWYQANWSRVPMAHIIDRRLERRTDAVIEIKAYSNLAELELSLNGRTIGRAPVEDHIARWNVTLATGRNRVTVTGDGVQDMIELDLVAASPSGASSVPDAVSPPRPQGPQKAPPGQ